MGVAETARLIASLELKDNMSKGLSTAERNLGKLENTSFRVGQHIGRGMQNAAANIAKLGVVAGAVAGGILVQSVRNASDLNETISKTNVVFGAAAGSVLEFGKGSAAALGLSQNAALSAAATYGNLFVSMGLTAQQAAGMSTKLVTLAGDLASFNNIDPSEAADKLRAGLTGESEPLKSLGININETIIKAKALELGLVKTGKSTAELKLKTMAMNAAQKEAAAAVKTYGAGSTQALKATVKAEKAQAALEKTTKTFPGTLDAATKAQAAYALIMEQSTTAQGDFGRTSTGLANQQRILKANFENISATLGTAVLPSVAKLFEKINAFVVKSEPAIEKLGAQLPALFDSAVAFVEGIPWDQVATGLQAAGVFASGLFKIFASLPPQVQGTIVALAALNKLSGGAVTGIVGELGKGLIKGVLGMNAGVVNINAGVVNGAGGVPGAAAGAAGGLGLASKVFLIGEAIGLGILVNEVRQNMGDQNSAKAAEIAATQLEWLKQQPTVAELQSGLAAIDKGINDIQANPLNVLIQGDALEKLKQMRADIAAQLARGGAVNPGGPDDRSNPKKPQGVPSFIDSPRTSPASLAAIEAILKRGREAGFKPTLAAAQATNQKNLERLASAQIVAMGKVRDAVAAADGTSELVGIRNAIAASGSKPPVTNVAVTVNVTAAQVKKSVTIQNRYGPSGGSRERGPTQFDI